MKLLALDGGWAARRKYFPLGFMDGSPDAGFGIDWPATRVYKVTWARYTIGFMLRKALVASRISKLRKLSSRFVAERYSVTQFPNDI
jgi:hypothetical protein